MSCPACGGNARLAIAPGFFRCQSPVAVPGARFSPGTGTPEPAFVTTVCNTEYQEATGVGVPCVFCGTDSIGSCQECGERVCGSCSAMIAGRRICRDHAAAARQAALAAHEASTSEAFRQVLEPVLGEVEARIAAQDDATARALIASSARCSLLNLTRENQTAPSRSPSAIWLTFGHSHFQGWDWHRIQTFKVEFDREIIHRLAAAVGAGDVPHVGVAESDPQEWAVRSSIGGWLAAFPGARKPTSYVKQARTGGLFGPRSDGTVEAWPFRPMQYGGSSGGARSASQGPSTSPRFLTTDGKWADYRDEGRNQKWMVVGSPVHEHPDVHWVAALAGLGESACAVERTIS